MISFGFPKAASLPGRTDVQCLHRWQKVLNPELVKGSWTEEVPINYPCILVAFKCTFVCVVHLFEFIFVSALTFQEDDIITEQVEKYGYKRWSVIAKCLPGRIGKQCRER